MFRKCAERFRLSRESGKLTRRSSRSLDPSEIILEGGPIGGPNEAPPLTVGDFHAVLTAAGILARTQSLKRKVPRSHLGSEGDTMCETPPSCSSGPVLTESSKLILPNGIQEHNHQGALQSRRDYQSNSQLERRPRFEQDHRKMNEYQLV